MKPRPPGRNVVALPKSKARSHGACSFTGTQKVVHWWLCYIRHRNVPQATHDPWAESTLIRSGYETPSAIGSSAFFVLRVFGIPHEGPKFLSNRGSFSADDMMAVAAGNVVKNQPLDRDSPNPQAILGIEWDLWTLEQRHSVPKISGFETRTEGWRRH